MNKRKINKKIKTYDLEFLTRLYKLGNGGREVKINDQRK